MQKSNKYAGNQERLEHTQSHQRNKKNLECGFGLVSKQSARSCRRTFEFDPIQYVLPAIFSRLIHLLIDMISLLRYYIVS